MGILGELGLRRHFEKVRRLLVAQQRPNIFFIGAAPGVTGDNAQLIHDNGSLETLDFEILTIGMTAIK
jgi:hypothetical protein